MKICPGDLHIYGDGRYTEVQWLCGYLLQVQPAELILSEVIDTWVRPWKEIVGTFTFGLLQITIAGLIARGCRVIIVLGNHDHRERKHYEQAFPGVEIVHTYEDEHFRYEHGWQQDFVWNIISPVAFWIAHKWPALALWIHSTFIRKTPGQHKGNLTSDWNMHVGLIHDRYRNKARAGKPFIIWHTHCPWAFDGMLADCGDMVDSFSWLEIEGQTVTLKYLGR